MIKLDLVNNFFLELLIKIFLKTHQSINLIRIIVKLTNNLRFMTYLRKEFVLFTKFYKSSKNLFKIIDMFSFSY